MSVINTELIKDTVYKLCLKAGQELSPYSYNNILAEYKKSGSKRLAHILQNAKNADKIKNVKVLQGDICNIKEFDFLENADVIISNPPYIRRDELANLQSEVKNEPIMALDGGKDGLDFYRVISDNWYSKLNDKGKLFLEIGNEQGESIFNVLYEFENISVIKDLYGNDRIVSADKK